MSKFLSFISMLFAAVMAGPASAQSADGLDVWGDSANGTAIQGATGMSSKDPRLIVGSVVRVLLGFLGIISVVIILYGGFKWMTAMGNEDQVGEAKKIMAAGIIGLVIVLAAFGIASFVVNSVFSATSDTATQ